MMEEDADSAGGRVVIDIIKSVYISKNKRNMLQI